MEPSGRLRPGNHRRVLRPGRLGRLRVGHVRVPYQRVGHVLGHSDQVFLGVGIDPGREPQPRGELVPVLDQRPHPPRPAIAEAAERLLDPASRLQA